MPATDSPAMLVARFLKANNYHETLDAFIQEAGLPLDAGTPSKDDLTIEKVLQEKKIFDLSVRFEKVGVGSEDGERGWRRHLAPSIPTTVTSLPSSSNLLHVSVDKLLLGDTVPAKQAIISTTADRRFNVLNPRTLDVLSTTSTLHDSPILSCAVFRERYVISTSMSGQVIMQDITKCQALSERRDHNKYVVKVAIHENSTGAWIATAGWDGKVLLYWVDHRYEAPRPPFLGDPVGSVKLSTNPEAVIFVDHPETRQPILLLTRRDSTFLYYYLLPESTSHSNSIPPSDLQLLGKQNLAPESNAWIAFTPSAIAISPVDPSLLAVATSVVPHMKLIIVRILIPPLSSLHSPHNPTRSLLIPTTPVSLRDRQDPSIPSAASQAHAESAIQDTEAAAIQIHVTTLAPQTAYSTPGLAWRPDGSGVWVNGDDGVVRGIDAASGKVQSTLKNGHEAGSKIRCLWAGWVDVESGESEGEDGMDGAMRREEWVVSGGFDRRLIVWK